MLILQEWLNLAFRWLHLVAGIMWLGQTWLFQWTERAMEPPADKDPNLMGELWMVHGGGFYFLQKQKWPKQMPHMLHWFKYEALFTWLSGVFLLAIVYWAGAPLLPYGSPLTQAQGIAISIASLVAGWIAYVAIWRSPLGKNDLAGAIVSWVVIVAATWGLGQVFSDRAAYLHIGAMFGTIMVCNVWMVIIPAQKKIMSIVEKGGVPDFSLSMKGKTASKHNTYMAIPLLFTMISNHFPAATFGREYNWLILGGLVLVGWAGAWVIREKL